MNGMSEVIGKMKDISSDSWRLTLTQFRKNVYWQVKQNKQTFIFKAAAIDYFGN